MKVLEISPNRVNESVLSKIPYKHQEIAVQSSVDYFIKNGKDRGKIIMPCGSGKSLTSLWILLGLKKTSDKFRNILITVPNLILQGQIFKTFYSKLNQDHNFICIGSDEDVLENNEGNIEVTTDSKDIQCFLSANKKSNTIVIATYQSLGILSDACNKLSYNFDLSIIDEAHRTVGEKGKCFSSILFDENIRIKKRLFMTATEKIYSGKENNIIAMDNEQYYGKTIYEYTLPQAIQDGVLSDYRVYKLHTTSQDVISFIKKNPYLNSNTKKLSDREKQNIVSSLLAVIKAINDKKCKNIITYHSTNT